MTSHDATVTDAAGSGVIRPWMYANKFETALGASWHVNVSTVNGHGPVDSMPLYWGADVEAITARNRELEEKLAERETHILAMRQVRQEMVALEQQLVDKGVVLKTERDAALAREKALREALANVLGFCATNQGMEASIAIDDARALLDATAVKES